MRGKFLKQTPILIVIMIIVFLAGCRKNYRCRLCPDSRKPPVANAGRDTTITLPVNSVMLDGSASSDADGTIIEYHWIKLSGNSSFYHFANENAAQTVVTNLTEGEYIFALEVKDNNLLYASDAVVINVRR